MKWIAPILLALALASTTFAQGIPNTPETSEWLWDRADLVTAQDAVEINRIMTRVGQAHSTVLVVVTIDRMSEYGGTSINGLATEWFNTWELGTEENNTGILLLVAKGDREARIELGADWGRRWDGYTQRIMNNKILPRFKQNDYSGGILAAVEGLETMAALGPSATPPQPGALEALENSEVVRLIRSHQPLPMWLATLCLVVGVGLCVVAIFSPDHRKVLLIVGILLIIVGITVWLLVAVFGAWAKGDRGNRSGFGGGGFSGGGGASGSW
jgi:uncharacterized protein